MCKKERSGYRFGDSGVVPAQHCQQSLEPAGISGRFHPHSYVDSSQLQVSMELLGLPIAVVQSSFLILASSFYQKCNLLKARVIIYAFIMFGSFHPSLWSSNNQSLLGSREPTLLCNQVEWRFGTVNRCAFASG